MTGLMAGKRGLILGVANDHSIAWGIAKSLHEHGAQLAFTYQGEALGRRVKPLAASLGSDIVVPCDVEDIASVDALFATLDERFTDGIDFVVHAIGFGTAGIGVWEATRTWLPAAPGHRLGTGLIVCLLGQGVGAFNEVVEFGASHLLAATNVGGYENTGRDLVANLVGTAVAAWLVSRRVGGSAAPRPAPSPSRT